LDPKLRNERGRDKIIWELFLFLFYFMSSLTVIFISVSHVDMEKIVIATVNDVETLDI
jgi:hypothetical protein